MKFKDIYIGGTRKLSIQIYLFTFFFFRTETGKLKTVIYLLSYILLFKYHSTTLYLLYSVQTYLSFVNLTPGAKKKRRKFLFKNFADISNFPWV